MPTTYPKPTYSEDQSPELGLCVAASGSNDGSLSVWSVSIFKGCVNVDNMVRKYCSLLIDDERFGLAQFMRDSILLRDAK